MSIPAREYEFPLDMFNTANNSIPPIEFVQGDIGVNKLKMTLKRDGDSIDLTGLSVTVTCKKPSSKPVCGEAVIEGDPAAGVVVYEVESNEIAEPGTVRYTVELYEGPKRISSVQFNIAVRAELGGQSAAESTVEYKQYHRLYMDTRHKEAYDPGTQYYENNIVTHQGHSWMALQDTIGNDPPDPAVAISNDYWALMAKKGEQGPQGEPGEDAPTPIFDNMSIYANSVSGNNETGDGSEAAPYASIARALDDLRDASGHFRDINSTVEINLVAGSDFDEIISLTYINGSGRLDFNGSGCGVKGVYLWGCSCMVHINSMVDRANAGESWATVRNSSKVRIYGVSCINGTAYTFPFDFYTAQGSINTTVINGAATAAIHVWGDSSNIHLSGISGTGGPYSIYAESSSLITKASNCTVSGSEYLGPGALLLITHGTPIRDDMTINVNSSTGNDETGDGSEGAPYASVTRALYDLLDEFGYFRDINSTVGINLAAGGDFDEDILLDHINGSGDLYINGNDCGVKSATVFHCNCTIFLVNMTDRANSGESWASVFYSERVHIYGISCINGSVYTYPFDINISDVVLDALVIDNAVNAAVNISGDCDVHASNITGTGGPYSFYVTEASRLTISKNCTVGGTEYADSDSIIIAGKPVTFETTLTSAGWSSQEQTINNAAIYSADAPVFLEVADDATDAEALAFDLASIRGIEGQAVGSFPVRAGGIVPAIDIPVKVAVL